MSCQLPFMNDILQKSQLLFKSDLLVSSATEQVEAHETSFALILLLTIIQKES